MKVDKEVIHMKKLLELILILICVFNIVGCNNTSKDLQTKFPEYYNLDTFKGIEVYLWQNDNDEYLCGAMIGTNRNKIFAEISALANNGATVEQMKTILSSYNIDNDNIIIIPISINTTDFEIKTDEFASINEVFWGN